MTLTRIILTTFLCFSGLLLSGCNKAAEGSAVPEKPVEKTIVEKKEPQKPAEAAPDFENAVQLTSRYDKEKGHLVAAVSLEEGYHAYAPGTELGVPVSMTISNENGWGLVGDIQIPKGEVKDLAVGVSNVIEGNFEMSAAIKGGQGDIVGEAKIQVCTEKVCDRPRKYPIVASAQ